MTFLSHVRISGLLIELQTLLVDRSVLSKAQQLADDIDQWNSLLQFNPGDGRRTTHLNQKQHQGQNVCIFRSNNWTKKRVPF